jgi:hypothetical protein
MAICPALSFLSLVETKLAAQMASALGSEHQQVSVFALPEKQPSTPQGSSHQSTVSRYVSPTEMPTQPVPGDITCWLQGEN